MAIILKCTLGQTADGYRYVLTDGKEYEVVDMQYGIFSTPYITVIGDNGEKVTAYYYRFDITKEEVIKYIKKHHQE